MSRIGSKPVAIPSGVKIDIKGTTVAVSGPKGQLSWDYPPSMAVKIEGDALEVHRSDDAKKNRELHGLTRALIANMVRGVSEGYEKRLLIFGTGYGCNVKGENLELNIGFTGRSVNKGPQFSIPIPDGLEVVIETPAARGDTDPAKMVVKGIDRQAVGQFAAEIRALRKPEPYKGKGIRYDGEHVQRKQGKALTSGG